MLDRAFGGLMAPIVWILKMEEKEGIQKVQGFRV